MPFIKFPLAGCNACYFGQITRHICRRVREHLVSDRASHVFAISRDSSWLMFCKIFHDSRFCRLKFSSEDKRGAVYQVGNFISKPTTKALRFVSFFNSFSFLVLFYFYYINQYRPKKSWTRELTRRFLSIILLTRQNWFSRTITFMVNSFYKDVVQPWMALAYANLSMHNLESQLLVLAPIKPFMQWTNQFHGIIKSRGGGGVLP